MSMNDVTIPLSDPMPIEVAGTERGLGRGGGGGGGGVGVGAPTLPGGVGVRVPDVGRRPLVIDASLPLLLNG